MQAPVREILVAYEEARLEQEIDDNLMRKMIGVEYLVTENQSLVDTDPNYFQGTPTTWLL